MKKILISSVVAVASALALNAGAVHATSAPQPPLGEAVAAGAPVGDAYLSSAGPVTTVANDAPVLTVPAVAQSPLPVTGADSNSTLTAGAIVLGVGGAMVIVGRTRRRRTVPAS